MRYETEQELKDKVAFSVTKSEDHPGWELLRADLLLFAQLVIDPLLRSRAAIDLVEANKEMLRDMIVDKMFTTERAEELQRLRDIEAEHFRCPTNRIYNQGASMIKVEVSELERKYKGNTTTEGYEEKFVPKHVMESSDKVALAAFLRGVADSFDPPKPKVTYRGD